MNTSLDQMPHGLREQWSTWLDQHGLDPNEIMLGREIRLDDEENRIYYTTIDRVASKEQHTLVTREVFNQLEAPALPFPGKPEWAHGPR